MTLSGKPMIYLDILLLNTTTDGEFGNTAVGVGGCGRDAGLSAKTLTQIIIAQANVLPKSMTTAALIATEVATDGDGVLLGGGARVGCRTWAGASARNK